MKGDKEDRGRCVLYVFALYWLILTSSMFDVVLCWGIQVNTVCVTSVFASSILHGKTAFQTVWWAPEQV